MVMHQVPHPEQKKANRFAAELLMPTQEIRDQLHGQIDVPLLLELKAQWKVSMWALLRRAHTFGILGDWQYRSLAVEMSSVGYRTSEPRAVLRATAAVRGVAVRRRLRSGFGQGSCPGDGRSTVGAVRSCWWRSPWRTAAFSCMLPDRSSRRRSRWANGWH
jgi:hypothetical protein